MTQNDVISAAAIGMAALAAWYVLRKPEQAGAQASQSQAAQLLANLDAQFGAINFSSAASQYGRTLAGQGLYLGNTQ
jgi:hypothetical protein